MTAHAAARQHGVVIAFALGRNAIAHYIHRRNQKNRSRLTRHRSTHRPLIPAP